METVLWHAVPSYLRKVDDILVQQMGVKLPLNAAPIKFASWMVCLYLYLHKLIDD